MTKEERREMQLRALAKWLLDADDDVDFERDGSMEIAIKKAVQGCMYKIGAYIEEILDMTDEQLNREQDV